jgi:hypothetical protein
MIRGACDIAAGMRRHKVHHVDFPPSQCGGFENFSVCCAKSDRGAQQRPGGRETSCRLGNRRPIGTAIVGSSRYNSAEHNGRIDMARPTTGLVHIGIKGSVVALDRRSGNEIWRTRLKGAQFVNVALDGDLLAIMEALYQEVTAKRGLDRSFEDMVKEIHHLIDQMDESERRTYLAESMFLNTVKYENDKLESYMRKLTKKA